MEDDRGPTARRVAAVVASVDSRQEHDEVHEPEELVRAANDGDQAAWETLVDRYNGLLWAIARGYRLSAADAAEVVQTTWLRLVEHLDRLRDPARVGAWLCTTLRRECLRSLHRNGAQIPSAELDPATDPTADDGPGPERAAVDADRDEHLWTAVDGLPDRCRRLLRLLMAPVAPSYEEISATLDMPIGSIGPTRARCLQRLRADVEAVGITADSFGAAE